MKCEIAVFWCQYCRKWRQFYRYPDGATRCWVCTACSQER